MNASKLISELVSIISQHGDIELRVEVCMQLADGGDYIKDYSPIYTVETELGYPTIKLNYGFPSEDYTLTKKSK